MTTQQGTAHHYSREQDWTYRHSTSSYPYAWSAECDLMAKLAGLEHVGRRADWARSPCTPESDSHISAWRLRAQRSAASS